MIKAEFLFSKYKDIPNLILPEIALVGRSNVGKSSLINHMVGIKKLAKVSDQPGKTQMLNFFKVEDTFILVDLPGYGYAKVPKAVQKEWTEAIDSYLRERTSLKAVILLLDIRRTPTDEDLMMIEWAHHMQKQLVLVFTKADKLKPKEQLASVEKNLSLISATQPEYILYSIKDPHCRKALYEQCLRLSRL